MLAKFIEDNELFEKVKKMDRATDVVKNLDKCGPKVWPIVQEYLYYLDELEKLGCFPLIEKFAA